MDLIYCTTRLHTQLHGVSIKCRLSVNTSALQQNWLFYCVNGDYYSYSQATIFGTSYLSGRVQEA